MTSLEFIMDMDTEGDAPQAPQINKNEGDSIPPGPSHSHSHDPSRAATSSNEKLKDRDDRLTITPSRRRGLSSRSSKPAATALSPSASPARPTTVSRRSTTSSESMDPSGYGSHVQGSSSRGGIPASNIPTRPMGASPGEGSVPVKLTPVTRRVSRAKKGMPVHTCETCNPPKTFTRAEHLRADLLTRHVQRHDHDDKKSTGGDDSRPASAASYEGGSSRIDYMSHPPSTQVVMSSPPDMSSVTPYPGLPSYHSTGSQGSNTGQAPMSPQQRPGQHESYPTSSGAPHEEYGLYGRQPNSIGGSPDIGIDFGIDYYPRPRTSSLSPFSVYAEGPMLTPNPLSLTIPDNNIPPGLIPGHEGSPWSSPHSDSNYSAHSELSHRRHGLRYDSPTSDWTGPSMYSSGASQALQGLGDGLETMTTSTHMFGTTFSPVDHMNLPIQLPDNHRYFVEHPQPYHYSSVRSPTPPTISLSAQSTENLVTLAVPSLPDTASMGRPQKGSTTFLGTLGRTALLTAGTLSPQVRNAIPTYLGIYWKRFDALFPLVHRKNPKTVADEILHCAMAAVGTQFLQGKEDRNKGNELHEFARKEAKLCPQWNLQIMQAIFLCELYARFRGRSVQRGPSEPFQSLYSRMVRHPIPDNFTPTASTLDGRWKEWIDIESQRRLLAACFIFDVHTSVYYQQHFPMSAPPTPLIKNTEDLWAAQSPENWEILFDRKPINTELTSLSGQVPFSAEQIASSPPIDYTVFLASEYLRLPRRSTPSILDLAVEVDETSTERIRKLFSGSAVGNAYLALYYTPLHDLLAVSGETWLFSRKLASPQVFQEHKRRLQLWCNSLHIGVATGFAAKALLAFFGQIDHSNSNSPLNATIHSLDAEEDDDQNRGKGWNLSDMSDMSDYWAMYVCALICWALGHRRGGGTGSGPGSDTASSRHPGRHSNTNAGEKGERETINWLKKIASLRAEEVLNMRGRREMMGVVSIVRRRLEDEAVGGKNKLLVDAMGTLKKLEERVNPKWF
ncbi:uncharacterized protein GGS25DRAFT_523668 [Hypoxylon fragiforme]|uniref:uncharacterized protein n=1 Tax=Hypoxylon fragiforme TaxID=63214 RepID=UPI0020C6B5D7|nr:uncharacterized protein GGS25DRAFT_523668 [Hypoxylon fragiforme]KAI2605999.1 hypothetical protein GGS25DRAFT_523668 [Hypoxylon fragiforme]